MTKWEYKVQELKFPTQKVDQAIEGQLVIEGQEGLELVTIQSFLGLSPSWVAICKRPIE